MPDIKSSPGISMIGGGRLRTIGGTCSIPVPREMTDALAIAVRRGGAARRHTRPVRLDPPRRRTPGRGEETGGRGEDGGAGAARPPAERVRPAAQPVAAQAGRPAPRTRRLPGEHRPTPDGAV